MCAGAWTEDEEHLTLQEGQAGNEGQKALQEVRAIEEKAPMGAHVQ